MRLQRTANAGVLLELDGKKILLDGVCREVSPYPATPDHIKQSLMDSFPDLVAVTHFHADHCDPDYERIYEEKTGKSVITPQYSGQTIFADGIFVSVLESRHIGKADCSHVSYWIRGSQTVLFIGDASPNQWKHKGLQADVLIAPFAYATTESAWSISREIAPNIVLLHLPQAGRDDMGLGDAVRQTVGEYPGVFIPKMEEFVQIDF